MYWTELLVAMFSGVVEPSGTKWNQVEPSRNQGQKVEDVLNGFASCHVLWGCGIKWNQVEPSRNQGQKVEDVLDGIGSCHVLWGCGTKRNHVRNHAKLKDVLYGMHTCARHPYSYYNTI